jgi:hypothetical protein
MNSEQCIMRKVPVAGEHILFVRLETVSKE